MKKSFTLKAFAFGAAAAMALTASATPYEFAALQEATPVAVLSNTPVDNVECRNITFTLSGKQEATPAKAPAKAEANYGDWTTAAAGQYTYTQMLDYVADNQWQRRNDSANDGNFQVKVLEWGYRVFSATSNDVVFTITKKAGGTYAAALTEAYNTGYTATAGQGGQKYPVYMTSRANWLTMLRAAGESFDDGPITDESIANAAQFDSFDNTTGVITFWPTYFLMIDNAVSWYAFPSTEKVDGTTYALTESYRMISPEYPYYELELDQDYVYFNHEKDASNGTYNDVYYNLNDNTVAYFQMVAGRLSGTALNNAKQSFLKAITQSDPSVTTVTEKTGKFSVSVPSGYKNKANYTLLLAYQNPTTGKDYMVGSSYITLPDGEADWYSVGNGTFTDATMYDALPVVFGADTWNDLLTTFESELGISLPSLMPEVNVPIQQSSTTEGLYRVVHPYAEFYRSYLADQLEYDAVSDFCKFVPTDASKVYIEPSATGIWFNTANGGAIMMVYGSTNKMQGGNENSADVWGTNSGTEITFPASIIPDDATSLTDITSAISWSQATFNTTNFAITYKAWSNVIFNPSFMKITGAFLANASTGIEAVAADAVDANAPVVYYNLQGQRVANPTAGQLVIKVQGNKAEKIIVR